MFKNKANILFLVFVYPLSSCNVNQPDSFFQDLEIKRYSLMSEFSANSEFIKETSSEISAKDYLNRQKYCPLSNLNGQQEISSIVDAYSNTNLLDTSTSQDIPAIAILTKTRELTSAKANSSSNLHHCYYPELYLANAYVLNILQRVPFAPFNQEIILLNQGKIDPSEVKNWNTNEIIKNSRFAKLNGIIRSANIAEKISAMDETRLSTIPRFYANKENNKVYLFGFQEQLSKESYYKHINSLANALSAIGYFERAMYRWKGVYTAEELNMQSSLPNDSLQEVYLDSLETLGKAYNNKESSDIKLSVKNIIAYDFIKAHEKSRNALTNKFCSTNSDFDKIPAHELNLCSEMKKIQNRAFNLDIKNMFCTSGKKFEQPKNPDEVIFNLNWNAIECEKLLHENPELENAYLDSSGYSYYDIYPGYLNSIKFTESIKNTEEKIENVKSKISLFNILKTQEYKNKGVELLDSIAALQDNLIVSKLSHNKSAEELAYYTFQKETAKLILESAKIDIQENAIEEKNKFTTYVNNLSVINSLNSLKHTLENYSSNKHENLNEYKKILCGDNDASCSTTGAVGEISKLYRQREIAVVNNWKNECSRIVRDRNNIARLLGNNGCDLAVLTKGTTLDKELKENISIVVANLKENKQYNSAACQGAAISEVMANQTSTKLKELLDLQTPATSEKDEKSNNDARDKYFKELEDKLNKFKYESSVISKNESVYSENAGLKSKGTSTSTITSTNSSDAVLKSEFNFARTIAEANSYLMSYNNAIHLTSGNLELLSEPQKYCENLYVSFLNKDGTDKPALVSILDSKIDIQKSELQKLQILRSIDQDATDLNLVTTEKLTNIDHQIKSLELSNKNIENILGISIATRRNILGNVNSEFSFNLVDGLYDSYKEKLRYLPLKNSINKKTSQESVIKSAEINESVAKKSVEIAKKQVENLQNSIEKAKLRVAAHNNEYFLFTSISPKITSFVDELWRIDHVGELAKQIVKIATINIMHTSSDKRNLMFDKNEFKNLVTLVSNVKYYCSYLSSFEDAQFCLKEIINLNEAISLKNDVKKAQIDEDFVIKIYSKDLRKHKKRFVSPEEQRSDDELLAKLNASGVIDINLTEDYFKWKKPLLREFSESFYKAKIIGISAVIYKNGAYESEFVHSPFDDWNNIAYLLHQGFQDPSSITGCSAKYENYASRLYHNYLAEVMSSNLSQEYEKFGKHYPKLFSLKSLLSYMCNRTEIINSAAVSNENSLIYFTDTNDLTQPITIFADKSTDSKIFQYKVSSMGWVEELQNDPSARPSESDGYWQPLTGFIGDLENRTTGSTKYVTQIKSCINVMNFDTESCAIPKKSVYKSFSGFPLLGNYKFVYAQHAKDLYISSFNEDASEGSFIDGIELNFIVSK